MFFIIVFGSKRYFGIIAISGFALGLTIGVCINGIPSGLLSGILIGLLMAIPSPK
jgi:predicted PurR-regulated permease PerM